MSVSNAARWGIAVLALAVYQILATAAFLLALPYLCFRAVRHSREMGERLGWLAPRCAGDPGVIWIHAASLGEHQAIRALLEDPVREFTPPVLVTVLSVSARGRAGAGLPCRVSFAPVDLFFAILPFLARTRPRGLLLGETELWPCTLALCHARGIPVAIVSARLSPRKWPRTRRLRFLLQPLLSRVGAIGAQGDADAARFLRMGARHVETIGNLKYRMSFRPELTPQPADTPMADMNDKPEQGVCLFVAGSVRLGEEGVLDVVGTTDSRSPVGALSSGSGRAAPTGSGQDRLLLLLAPRHLREREHWLDVCRRRQIVVLARSECDLVVPPPERLHEAEARALFRGALRTLPTTVLLLDTHGELASWYAAADLAFVGGTLVPIGGHNLFEPAREGVPVAFGPYTDGVEDLAAVLLRHRGGFRVPSGAALNTWVETLRRDAGGRRNAGASARAAAEEVAGAVERTWVFLEHLGWPRVRPRVERP